VHVHPAELPQGLASPVSLAAAHKATRVAAYLIDALAAVLLVNLVGFIPSAGIYLAVFCLLPFWLLRDVTGASLGKLLLRLKVVTLDGQPATLGPRILRNLPLAIGPLCALIPYLGYFFAAPLALIVILFEGLLLLTQGHRLGDRLANTTVVRK
jgi:uncharacterized RDD family membrane protein YckC